MIKRLNKACKFFPCHSGLEDCTFCYCPFYPCLDEEKGKFVYSVKRKQDIWSCKSCGWIHKIKNTEDIFISIRKNRHGRRNLKSDKTGIVILGHGSKLKKANASLYEAIRLIKQNTGLSMIVPAYLQSYQPCLEKSVKGVIAKGCRRVIIVPFFLFNGNHVTRDIPGLIVKEKAKYPEIDFLYTKSLGQDTRIADIVSDMVGEAVQSGNTN